MEHFYTLMRSVGMPCFRPAEVDDVNIIGCLPEEVSVKILRLLDAESLVSAALVNKQWSQICQTDRTLRQRVYLHLRRERCNIFESLEKCQPKVIRGPSSGSSTMSRPFSHRNERFKIQKSDHREILHSLPNQNTLRLPQIAHGTARPSSGAERPHSVAPPASATHQTHTPAAQLPSFLQLSVGIGMPSSRKRKLKSNVAKSKKTDLLKRLRL